MAPRKKGSKPKRSASNTSLAFALIALVIIGALFYYLITNKSDSTEEVVRPLKKEKPKQEDVKPDTNNQDSLLAESAEKDSVKDKPLPKEEKIVTPKPTITEKGKVYSVDPKLPKVCIIVDDFGYINGPLLTRFLELDKNIAFSILPGLENSISTMKKARQAGHEVLIHVPMEPESYPKDNPGQNAILVNMTNDEISKQVDNYIYQLNLAIGANHHMGSKAAADTRVATAVLDRFKQEGMFYIDSYTNDKSVIEKIARAKNIPFARRNVFLDVPESSKHRAILKIEEMAKMKSNLIVVITHCHTDVKYRQLEYFIERLKDKHYQIIPASKAVRMRKQIA